MILHHVAKRADAVVIIDPTFQSDRFGNGNLDVVDVCRVPQWLENQIGEAQRQQVLDGFFAQIMVDPENPVLGKSRGHRIVDPARRFQVGPERFFQADPNAVMGQACRLQSRNRLLEQRRRRRQEDR